MIPIVLYYHQVVQKPRPEHYLLQSALTVDEFRAAMLEVKTHWRPLGVDELVSIQRSGAAWPKDAVAITFDDGFKNNLWAAEVLRDLEMSAVFFITSHAVGKRFRPWFVQFAQLMTTRKHDVLYCSWGAVDFRDKLARRRWLKQTKDHLLSLAPDARDAALAELAETTGCDSRLTEDPDLEFMSPDDLRRLVDMGMTVGSHTQSHDNLARCTPEERQAELFDSADELQRWTGREVRYFAYPDGRYLPECVEMVRSRYDAAFTTKVQYTAADLCQFPRRAADGYRDVRQVLNILFPAKRRLVDVAKRILGC